MKINIIKSNLEKYIAYKKLSNQEFEKSIGVSNGYIAKLKGSMGKEKLDYMLEVYSDLNRDWLLYGEGEMLKKPTIVQNNINGDNLQGQNITLSSDNYMEIIREKDRQLQKRDEQIDRLITLLEKK